MENDFEGEMFDVPKGEDQDQEEVCLRRHSVFFPTYSTVIWVIFLGVSFLVTPLMVKGNVIYGELSRVVLRRFYILYRLFFCHV